MIFLEALFTVFAVVSSVFVMVTLMTALCNSFLMSWLPVLTPTWLRLTLGTILLPVAALFSFVVGAASISTFHEISKIIF